MTRNVIYEIGRVRVWYDPPDVYFEIIDDCRRLETSISALDDMPYLLKVLIEQQLLEFEVFLKRLNERHKELDSWYHELEQKIEEYKMKGWRPMCEGVKKKQQKTVEKIKEVEEMIQFVSDFKGSLERILNDLNRFIEIVEKARKEVIV